MKPGWKEESKTIIEERIFSMPVKRGCICLNAGRPDENGICYFSPACQVANHGLRACYVVHDLTFGGFDRVVEEPPRSKSAQHRARLPVNTESLRADARLSQATRRCAARLAARENVSVSYRTTNVDTVNRQPSTERS